MCVQLDAAQNIPVDLRLSILKPLCAKWIESLYQYVLDNPSIVKNGFKAAGILEVIQMVHYADTVVFIYCRIILVIHLSVIMQLKIINQQ